MYVVRHVLVDECSNVISTSSYFFSSDENLQKKKLNKKGHDFKYRRSVDKGVELFKLWAPEADHGREGVEEVAFSCVELRELLGDCDYLLVHGNEHAARVGEQEGRKIPLQPPAA